MAVITIMMTISASAQFYIYCSDGTIAKVDSISVIAPKNIENGHEYVDLGLSVNWATCNVGARYPESYGDYFAWGEIESKSHYHWSTYKWCNGSNGSNITMTKYNTQNSGDNKTILDATDDAATVNWGGSWRMPTKAELDELRKNCTWEWTTLNGVNGYMITGRNGNSIFLPAAGYRSRDYLDRAGTDGYYWSNTLRMTASKYANKLCFYEDNSDWGDFGDRFFGQPIRPVCPLVSNSSLGK